MPSLNVQANFQCASIATQPDLKLGIWVFIDQGTLVIALHATFQIDPGNATPTRANSFTALSWYSFCKTSSGSASPRNNGC